MNLESLESRQLLAGNVTVRVSDGICRVSGTNGHDEIFIEQLTDHRLKFTTDNASVFNGQSELITSGASKWIHINLGGGADRVVIRHPRGVTSFKIDGGQDGLSLAMRRVSARNITVIGSSSRDDLLFIQCRVRNQFNCVPGKREDKVRITQSRLYGHSVLSDSSGQSNITIDQTEFTDLGIYLSPQNDNLWNTNSKSINNSFIIQTGDGDDLYSQSNFYVRDDKPQINLGSGVNRSQIV